MTTPCITSDSVLFPVYDRLLGFVEANVGDAPCADMLAASHFILGLGVVVALFITATVITSLKG